MFKRNGLILNSFQVAEQCGVPRGICKTCLDDALAAFTFRRLSRASAEHWDNAATLLTQLHEPTKDDKSYYVFYPADDKSVTVFKDQAQTVKSKDQALQRLFEFKKPRRTKKTVNFTCSCLDCGKTFNGPLLFNRHLRNTQRQVCNECGKLMAKEKLASHLSKHHNTYVYDCSICHKLFSDNAKLMQHSIKSHSNKNTQCRICKCGFESPQSLNAHMYYHSLFHCSSCPKSFDNLKCQKYHQSQCHSDKSREVLQTKFTCDYCGSSYDKKPSLRIHIIQKHLHVLPYVCETCGKRTSTIAHLKSHEAVHTQKRKIFECHCGARMRTELGYQMHQRIHTGEKPYQCEECGDKFLSASRKLDHIKRRHRSTKDMPHGCDKCPARFVRPFELKKHYLTAHYSVIEVAPAPRAIRRTKHSVLKSAM